MRLFSKFRFTLCLVTLVLFGCSLGEIKKQTEVLDGAALIRGKITNASTQSGPLNALAFELIDGEIVYQGSTYVTENGEFQFYVTPGTYQIVAHLDSNEDGEYQPGEAIRLQQDQTLLTLTAGDVIDLPEFVFNEHNENAQALDTSTQETNQYANLGKVVALDDPIFNRENYGIGLWRPLDFIATVGGGLFLLDEYNPSKIPVLFVHGINGGPLDWQTVIEQLDKSRYQAWVYYYASGLQLEIISDTLMQSVADLQKRFGFKHIKVAAHSMGGLVTRAFIQKYAAQHPKGSRAIDVFMTVNSPMGGMASAAKGVKYSPIVVQSWKDVAAGSDYLNHLFQTPWPETIPYHLVFSYLEGKDGDGVVTMNSQLPRALQTQAKGLYGFPNSHVGTLSDPEFIALFNEILLSK